MDALDSITIGSQLLSATGRLWTVRSITPTGTRVMLTSEESDGPHGAMVDLAAIRRMVRIDQAGVGPTAPIEAISTGPATLVRS